MTKQLPRTLKIGLFGFAIAWLGFVGIVWRAMNQTPEQFGQFMSKLPMPAYFLFPFETMWTHARAGTVQPGDVAPDFELETQDKTTNVRLSSFRGSSPVVLVFGSYT
jgi:hypothetical protein